jgi:hypothetical protein
MPYNSAQATKGITVTEVTISASVTPTTQKAGGTVTFTGTTSGIPAGEKIYLQVYGTDGTWAEPSQVCQPVIGSDGKFQAPWTVPWDARGRKPCETWRLRFVYYWYTSNEMSLTVYYDTRIRNFTAPDSVMVGQTFTISGYLEYESASAVWSGLAGKTVSLYYNGTKIGDVTTGSTGFFSKDHKFDKAGSFTLKAVYPGEGFPAAAAFLGLTVSPETKTALSVALPIIVGAIAAFASLRVKR